MVKICIKCGQEKTLNLFSKDKQRKDGLTASCKSCHQLRYVEARDSILKTVKQYQKDNSAKIREYKAEYRKNNREAFSLKDTNYRKANRDKFRSYTSKYKASKLQATPLWFEHDKVSIVYKKATEWGLEVDHVIPLQGENVCGLHCWANLQLLDKSLNSSKGNRSYPCE